MGSNGSGGGGGAGGAGRGGRTRTVAGTAKPFDENSTVKDLHVHYKDLTQGESEATSAMITAHRTLNAVYGGYADEKQLSDFNRGYYQSVEANFNSLLDKLPPVAGMSYNIKWFEDAAKAQAFVNQYKVGSVFTNNQYFYTHRKQTNRYGFQNDAGPTRVRTYVKGKTGRDIGPYFDDGSIKASRRLEGAKDGDRYYTMFGANRHRFRITKVTQTKNGTHEIYMEEI